MKALHSQLDKTEYMHMDVTVVNNDECNRIVLLKFLLSRFFLVKLVYCDLRLVCLLIEVSLFVKVCLVKATLLRLNYTSVLRRQPRLRRVVPPPQNPMVS